MAISYGFFNSLNGDRTYNADEMSTYFKGLVSDGVYENVEEGLQVLAGTGMTVNISAGRALLESKWLQNDAVLPITINPAHVTLNRYTAVVARLDKAAREITIVAKDGENATDPVEPEIIRSDTVMELCLAIIYVERNAVEITQSVIIDTRIDADRCGFVTGLIDQVDTAQLFLQWQTAYEEYFNDMENWKIDQKTDFDTWFTALTDELNVNTYVQQFKRDFVTTAETTSFNIGIEQYAAGDIVDVYINGMRLTSKEYTVLDANVTLTYVLDTNQAVEIVVIKSQIGWQ